MRGSVWLVVSVLAVAAAGCAPHKAPPAPAASAAPAAPAPEPAAAETLPPAPPPPPVPQVTPPASPKPEIIRFSPADYGARERRINALINNAESRDTSGETQYVAEQGRAQRERCATKACIEHSYAAEEARLRKWEGSSDIK